MNKIKFIKARVKNFLSFGNTWQEITFPAGMNLVQGLNVDTEKSNGAGKSTLTEVIPFGLYGKTIKNLPQAKVVNWHNRSGCVVELTLEMSGNEYTFIRGLRPNKFVVKMNGNEIVRPSDAKSFQYQMEEEVIGMDFKTFKNLIYFSPNNTISILGAKKEVKRQFLESLFDLSDYSEMLKVTNEKLKTLKDRFDDNETQVTHNNQMSGMLQRDIDETKPIDMSEIHKNINMLEMTLEALNELSFDEININEYSLLQHQLEECKKHQQEQALKKVELTTNIKSTQESIDSIDLETPTVLRESVNEKIAITQQQIDDIIVEEVADLMVTYKEEIETLVEEVKEAKVVIAEKKERVTLYGYSISNSKDNIAVTKGRSSNIANKAICDFCGSECDHDKIAAHHEEQIKEYEEHIAQQSLMIGVLEEEMQALEKEVVTKTDKAKFLSNGHKELKQRLSDHDLLTRRIESHQESLALIADVKVLELDKATKELKLKEYQQELIDVIWKFDMGAEDVTTYTEKVERVERDMESYKKHTEKVTTTQTELNNQKSRLDELQNLANDQEAKLASKRVEIVNLSKANVELTASNTKFGRMIDHLAYLRVSLKDENVKQFAISALLPYLNHRANYYLSESGFPYMVNIDGWLDVVIRGMGTEDVGYDSLSGGESKAMDMAIQLACNDIAELHAKTSLGVAIYDEIMDTSLDADGVQKLMNIVKVKQSDTNNCVLVISHRDEVKELDFDGNIRVEKENGFTTIQSIQTMV